MTALFFPPHYCQQRATNDTIRPTAPAQNDARKTYSGRSAGLLVCEQRSDARISSESQHRANEAFPVLDIQPMPDGFQRPFPRQLCIWDYDQTPQVSTLAIVLASLKLPDMAHEITSIRGDNRAVVMPTLFHNIRVVARNS